MQNWNLYLFIMNIPKLPKGSWFFLYHSTTATNREWTFVHFCYKNIIMKCKHKVDRRMERLYIILRSLWILVQKIDRDLQLYIYIYMMYPHKRILIKGNFLFSSNHETKKNKGKIVESRAILKNYWPCMLFPDGTYYSN